MDGGSVYFIQNLINGKRYVGQTTRTVEERFKEHAKADSHLGRAIRKYGVKNFKYGVIKTCATAEELNYWERYYIAALKTKSPTGYNLTDGGDNGFTVSDESRAKMANSHRGVKRSPETIAKMSAANKGKKLSAEHRAKISAAGRGRACSPETRAKIAAAQKGKPRQKHSPETRAKISAANKGRKRTPETCAKISAVKKGRSVGKLPPETRAKISAANRGLKRSPETRARISAVQNGKYIPPEQRAKISAAHKGKKFSAVHRAHLSAALKGRPQRNPVVYPVLLKEMLARKISYAKLGKVLGISANCVSGRMQGKMPFTPAQMTAIRDFLGVAMTVAELFRRA